MISSVMGACGRAAIALLLWALIWVAVVATNAKAFVLVVDPNTSTSWTELLRRPAGGVLHRRPASKHPSSWCRLHFANQDKEETSAVGTEKKKVSKPEILAPFPPAADPEWMHTGPVGEGDFVLSREGGPTDQEIANENILKIVISECSDLEVNTLAWKCLGYRFQDGKWTADECFPNWKEKYPTPPDLIGMQRIYSPEIDKPSLRSNQALVRSIPTGNKQSLKEHLKPLGWKGFQYAELTPNKTRRAQCANWLVFYREELYGYTLEELKERRKERKAEEVRKRANGEWQPPVQEVL